MLQVGTRPSQLAPSRLQYRLTRFLLSKSFYLLTRIVLPLLVLAFILLQLWNSENLRNWMASSKNGIVESVAYSSMFRIDEIRIENMTNLQEDEILAALDVELPSSTLLLDREKIHQNLAGYDAVGQTRLRLGMDGVMRVMLTPRTPAMLYFDGTNFETVDETGHRVGSIGAREDAATLFVISGEGAKDAVPEAQKLSKLISPFSEHVRGLVRVGERRWDIVLTGGGRLLLPESNPVDALRLIITQHQKYDVLNRDILRFDMRDPARPILRMSDDAKAALEATIANQTDTEDTGQAL